MVLPEAIDHCHSFVVPKLIYKHVQLLYVVRLQDRIVRASSPLGVEFLERGQAEDPVVRVVVVMQRGFIATEDEVVVEAGVRGPLRC